MSPMRRPALAPVLGLLAGLVLLGPVLLHPGWPYNHDGLRPLVRAAAVLGQWRLGHPLPIWSSLYQQGAGSPAPILYHKLFSALLAVALALAAPKAALCLVLLLCMMAGFLGTGLVLRAIAGRPVPAVEALCGWVLLSCNYATTDWLVRGAMAEFATLCLLPLLFAWCIVLLQHGRCSRWIGPLMALLWLAHSGIALFATLPLGLCVALALARHGTALRTALRPLGQSLLLFAVLALPFVVAALPMLAFADTPFLVLHFTPALTHTPASRLFSDPGWQWGRDAEGMTIAIDPLLLAVVPALPPVIVRCPALRWPGLLMLLTALVVLLLQTRAAVPLFGLVPGLRYIQFTWRLLCFLSVALSVGLGIVLLALLDAGSARLRATALPALVCLAVLSGLGRPRAPAPSVPWFGAADLTAAGRGIATSGLSMEAPEYLPRVQGGPVEWDTVYRSEIAAGLCTARRVDGAAGEEKTLSFRDDCPAGATVALPVFLAPGMRASAGGIGLPMTRGCRDPRPRLHPGPARAIVLQMPRLLPAVGDWWRGAGTLRGCRD